MKLRFVEGGAWDSKVIRWSSRCRWSHVEAWQPASGMTFGAMLQGGVRWRPLNGYTNVVANQIYDIPCSSEQEKEFWQFLQEQNGKPYDWRTLPAFFPIMFELTVLFSAFTTIASLMIMNQLPKWYHPVFNWERFSRVTDDGFFVVIEARDPKFSETKTRALLEEIGGQHVTLIHD